MTNALTIFNQLSDHIQSDMIKYLTISRICLKAQNFKQIIHHMISLRTVIQNTIFRVNIAGYSKNDIIVEVKDNTPSIKSVKKDVDDKIEVLHKGIARRYFERHFNISDVDVKVNGAEFLNKWFISSFFRKGHS